MIVKERSSTTQSVPTTSAAEQNLAVIQRFYRALGTNDGSKVVPVLTDDFVGTVATGMPNGLGGVYHGNENAVAKIWLRIWSMWYVHGEPTDFLPVDDDRVVVLGRYVGEARNGNPAVYATFAHVFTVRGDRLASLEQITDTAQWLKFPTREQAAASR